MFMILRLKIFGIKSILSFFCKSFLVRPPIKFFLPLRLYVILARLAKAWFTHAHLMKNNNCSYLQRSFKKVKPHSRKLQHL